MTDDIRNSEANVVCDTRVATITIDTITKAVQLWVVADSAQHVDLLIGRTFTEADNVSFIKTKNGITLWYNYEYPFKYCEF